MTVLCTGAAVVDILLSTPETLPEPGGSRLVETIALAPGGCGINTAIGLARLGVPVEFAARLGLDGAGDLLRAELARAGVGLTYFYQQPDLATKHAVVLLGGERSFLRTRGGGNAIGRADFEAIAWPGLRFVHIGGCYSLRQLLGDDLRSALATARRAGAVTVLDTVHSSDGSWQALIPALPEIDHLLPSLAEAQAISGEQEPEAMARWFRARGSHNIVIKLGSAGAYACSGEDEYRVAAAPVPGGRVVDTTGAGDAFCAGYLAALWHGLPLAEALRWAAAWGAVAVSELGATAALRDRSQLEAVLASTAIHCPDLGVVL